MTKISPASLTATVDSAADLLARNLPQQEEFNVTVKIARLLLVAISNTFCSKTFKYIVFCHNNVLLFLCFFLLLFTVLLSTITRKKCIPDVTFLRDSESSLHP